MDYYLKATSRAALHEALSLAGLAEGTGDDWRTLPHVTLDEIGRLGTPTSTPGLMGDVVYTFLPGYHANLRMEEEIPDPTPLPLIDPPASPHRMWACELPVDTTPEYDPENPVERPAP